MSDCIWIHYSRPRPHWYGLAVGVQREKQAAWQAVMPIHDAWRSTAADSFPNYEAGSQGPAASDALLAADGRSWRPL